MKILFVSRGLGNPKGGAQTISRVFCDELKKYSEIKLYTLTDVKYDNNSRVIKLPLLVSIPILGYWIYRIILSYHLKRLAREIDPDLIIISIYSGNVIRPPPKYPVVVWFHDIPNFQVNDTISPRLIALFLKIWYFFQNYFKKVLFKDEYYFMSISNEMTQTLKKANISSTHIFTLPFGMYPVSQTPYCDKKWLQIKNEYNINDDDIILLFIGQLYFTKGLHTIIEALKLVNNEKIKLLVVGDKLPFFGHYYVKNIKKIISKYSLEQQVIWLHKQKKEIIALLYKKCNFLLSASYSEGCQLTLLEGAYYNIPIIATNVGATVELFNNKINFFSPGDSKTLASILSKNIKSNIKRIDYTIYSFNQYIENVIVWFKYILNEISDK